MESSYEPRFYRIRIKGHLDKNWAEWFNGMSIHHEERTTIIEGDVTDNASLHSILNRINDLNLTILSLEHVQ